MRTALATEHLRVTPGVPTLFEIEVTNTSDVIDGISAAIEGLDPAWVQLIVPVVSLFPEASATVMVRLDLPVNCIAGDYLITVRVFSTVDPERTATHQFWLTVEPIERCMVQLRPSVVYGGKRAEMTVLIANQGNVTVQAVVRAEEDTKSLTCVVDPPAVAVAPGTIEPVVIEAVGPRPWFAQSVSRNLVVTTVTPSGEFANAGTFVQKPRVPRGVLTFLILGGIIALWATIFLVIISALRKTEDPALTVPASFNQGGLADVPLLAVAGSAGGKVTAELTGDGLPRITVEAKRLNPDGTSELISSASTTDDGTYELATLLPGQYKLRFSSEGFKEIWYPDAPDEATAKPVTVEPGKATGGLDIVISGKDATFKATLLAPEGAKDLDMKVTITRVLADGTLSKDPADVVETTAAALAQGIGGLKSPATYHFKVEAPGFEALEFDQQISGGATSVLNSMRLGSSLGSISGTTLDSNGNALGGVKVTVSSGEFTKEAVTPTQGNVGGYTIDGLPTPNTYVVTFTADGFATVSLALDLGAGEATNGINATLSGGVGTATGSVTTVGGSPLGGVKVTVVGGLFTASSETLTTGNVGSYIVTGIPTPGTVTLTFAADGYLPETRVATFGNPGTIGGIDVTLSPSTATVSGTVSTSGNPTENVVVKLSDGINTRSTNSASSPSGRFSFTQVPPGSYTLTFEKSGFETRVILVRVAAGDSPVVDVDLPAGGP